MRRIKADSLNVGYFKIKVSHACAFSFEEYWKEFYSKDQYLLTRESRDSFIIFSYFVFWNNK